MKTENQNQLGQRRVVTRACCLALLFSTVGAVAFGQAFSSGSDESDGALTLAANLGTVIFDPFDTARWGRVLDPDGDGVYNFTTITIGSGTTLRLGGDKVNRPVYWLATGNVVITGTVDLNGRSGVANGSLDGRRQVAIPGSGGYAGGAGGIGSALPPTAGEGPAGATGIFQLSDAIAINTGDPVSLEIEAKGIPPGTVVTLQIYPEIPVDPTTVNLTTQATLTGTLQLSTATASFAFPFGFSRGFVRASW